MNKGELVEALSVKLDVSRVQADKMLNTFIELVTGSLKKGDDVAITGFGTFLVAKRAARNGINPKTRAAIKIPASKVPRFKAGKTFKDIIKG